MNYRSLRARTVVVVAAASIACTSLASDVARDGTLAAGQTTSRHVRINDENRDYLLHVPQQPSRNILGRRRPYPLVIVMHGSRGHGETIRRDSGMDSIADARSLLVAYPDGRAGFFGMNSDWNAGECCGGPFRDSVDDIGFIRAIIADVSRRLPVDQRRIYVAGFSDGARMAYRAACEMSTELAAVAAVSGSLVDAHCTPKRALPVIAFHGTADAEVPFADSTFTAPSRVIPAASALPPTIQFWLAADGCRDVTTQSGPPRIRQTSGIGCVEDVLFYAIDGVGHGWPVAPAPKDSSGTGWVISASPLIADFFFRHRRP